MIWKAVFKDGTSLEQFDVNGNEILFAKVLDRVNDLKTIAIHLKGGLIYSVSILDGSFNVNGRHFYVLD
ncbi:hypothetical protein LCGC14_2502270, partial [marine sediment metagenome]